MVDRFPEAFERFEKVVDVDRFESYKEMSYAFGHWAGKRWRDTYAQNLALKREGERRGFKDAKMPMYFRKPQVSARQTWRFETVTVRGKPQVRYRDLKTGRFIKKP